MSELKGAMIIGQSGGPTAVINASAYGAIRAGLDADCITKVYGASHGIVGVLNDELFVMDEENPAELDGVLAAWQSGRASFDPGACTRGLYLRGVE